MSSIPGAAKRAPPYHTARNGSKRIKTNYTITCFIDKGTFGLVSEGQEYSNPNPSGRVALKKLKSSGRCTCETACKAGCVQSDKHEFPLTGLREIIIMKQLAHENIAKLREVVVDEQALNGLDAGDDKSGVFMVLDYMPHDLDKLLKGSSSSSKPFIPSVPCIMGISHQMLTGITYMHSKNIIHRDLKTANILVSKDGVVKITDFGLARPYEKRNPPELYTPGVCSAWYRPPEVFYKLHRYDTQLDNWSAGCIIAELFLMKPLFQTVSVRGAAANSRGQPTDIDVLHKIVDLVGTPERSNEQDVNYWRELAKSDQAWNYKTAKPRRVQETLRKTLTAAFKAQQRPNNERDLADLDRCMPNAIKLIDELLIIDPAKRLAAKDALFKPFFWMNSPKRASQRELAQALPKMESHPGKGGSKRR